MEKYAVMFVSWQGCEEVERFAKLEEAKAYAEKLEEEEGKSGYSVEEGYEVMSLETRCFIY